MLIPHRIARRLVSCLGLLVAAWPLTVAEAKGPFDLLVVCDGLGTCFEVADPPLLDFFSFADFTQPLEDAPQPKPEAASLLITRYGLDRTSGEFIPFDRLRYYGDVAGSAGYVYYEGLINGRSEYKGYWYRASPSGEKALMQAIATSTPAIPTSWPYTALVFSLILLGCATILMMALIVRRRTLSGSLPSSR